MASTALSPSQKKTFAQAAKDVADTNLVVVWGRSGLGRTTILKALHAKSGGTFLSMRDYVERMEAAHPLAFEETFQDFVPSAFKKNRTVYVDDLHLLNSVVCCGSFYPRKDFLQTPLTVIASYVEDANKRLVVATSGSAPDPLHQRSNCDGFHNFAAEDYEFLVRHFVGKKRAKTTVGRALAHRLKGKFFVIDGTFITGTRNFYERIQHVFNAAQQNGPSVIFIDDSDVIFETGKEEGLYRYLLTLLDGLESKSAGRVTVMMTAMDVGGLPPALVRSGRIELWLETRLPDLSARTKIVEDHAAALPKEIGPVDVRAIAEATDGLTGADLKALTEDGTMLFAFDRAKNRPAKPATDYFLAAIETIRSNKQRYAEAEAKIHAQRRFEGVTPPWMRNTPDLDGDEDVP